LKLHKAVTLLCVLLLAALMPVQVLAAGAPDASLPVELHIAYSYAGAPLTGAQFDVYLLAERDSRGELVVTDDFKAYPVDYFGEDVSGLASTLKSYIMLDNPIPFASGTIDAEGALSFTTENDGLKHGMYLVIPMRFDTQTHVHDAQPMILHLPVQDGEEWCYEATVNPKPQVKPKEDDTPIERRVLKVWDDASYETLRPSEIKIHLLRDGDVYDTVVLNQNNNWRHTWDNLNGAHQWTVAEEAPESYTVTITKQGVTFMVTNTYEAPPVVTPTPTPPVEVTPTPTPPAEVTPTPTPPAEVTPTPTPPAEVTPTPTPPVEVTPTPTPKPTLPQTGQLWWPIPILLMAGLVLVLFGVMLRRGDDYED